MKLFFATCMISLTIVTSSCCTTEVIAGIKVVIYDRATGENITELVEITVTDGNYTDEPMLVGEGDYAEYWCAIERSGIYDIEVSATGYNTYTAENIKVQNAICHVTEEELEVYLEH